MFPATLTTDQLDQFSPGTLVAHLGIKFIEIGENFISATMPVDERTVQPFGILHGGASVVLAETLGSIASAILIDQKKYAAVGLEINANHIRAVKSGEMVTGTARPVHIGRKTHIWQIEIMNKDDKLVCTSRLTIAILDKNLEK